MRPTFRNSCCPAVFLLFLISAPAEAKVKVVATLPVLKDFVEAVGKERVEVRSLISGLESEHTYTPRPSDLATVAEARMLVKIGLGLEIWVDGLVKNAGNSTLLVITTSDGVPLLRDQAGEEHRERRRFKERHSMGNPHIWLDPENAKIMIRHITAGLIKVDPENRAAYLKNQSDFFEQIDSLERTLKRRVSLLPDRRIITHHPAWPYFARRFGFVIVGNIQAQVGSEPSARRLSQLIDRIRREKIRVVVSEPQLSPRIPDTLRRETGVKVVLLSPLPGAIPGTESYLKLISYSVGVLANALEKDRT